MAGQDHTISVRALRAQLPALLKRVQSGEALVVTSRGKPVARLVPPAAEPATARPFGLLRGTLHLPAGWDAPDEALIEAMEAGPVDPRTP